jgi:ADP-dependent NAD(P)H-hydrate dehydratase / NAD(P)H-hydrate epimerase
MPNISDPIWPLDLLTSDQMAAVDAGAIASGLSVETLMAQAGQAVAAAVQAHWSSRPVIILCGPGNNGGDGWVAARVLSNAGWPVRLISLVPRAALTGAAAHHAALWQGEITLWEGDGPAAADAALILDALFGAGSNRALPPTVRRWLARHSHLPLVAIDVPSGVAGSTGEVFEWGPQATLTVTFHRYKPGHFIMPGKALCGNLHLADIGIPASILPGTRPACRLNHPTHWIDFWRKLGLTDHKFTRGWVMIRAGHPAAGGMSGAAILSSRAARRAGAGLVSLVSPSPISDWPGTLISPKSWEESCAERRATGFLVGPGNGVGEATRDAVLVAAATGKPLVLDADALTSFAGKAELLRRALCGPCVLTPHAGEFARLFAGTSILDAPGRLAQAQTAAKWLGATIVLKGPDTLIARPNGLTTIQAYAPASLATAGSGDVLAGLIIGLLAQGFPAGAAAEAGVWLHASAAEAYCEGGMIAEDLVTQLTGILCNFYENKVFLN